MDTELHLTPVINVKAATESLRVVEKGPITCAPIDYTADSATDGAILFQNVVPAASDVCIQPNLMVTYEFYAGFTVNTAIETPFQTLREWGVNFLVPNFDKNSSVVIGTTGAQFGPSVKEMIGTGDLVNVFDLQLNGVPGYRSMSVPAVRLRSLPLQSVTSNIDLKINGAATSFAASQFAPLWPMITDPKETARYLSTCPFYQDLGIVAMLPGHINPRYLDWFHKTQSITEQQCPTQYGCVSSSLVAYAASNAGPAGNPDANTPWNALSFLYKFRVQEPLIIPPFRFGETYDEAGVTRILNLTINLTMNNLKRMLVLPYFQNNAATSLFQFYDVSFAQDQSFTIPAVAAGGAGAGAWAALPALTGPPLPTPRLTLLYSQADALTRRQESQFAMYQSDLVQGFMSAVNEPATTTEYARWEATPFAQERYTATSQAIRLPSIPQMIYVWIGPSEAAKARTALVAAGNPNHTPPPGFQIPDTFINITSASINFMDRVGLFSTYDEVGLYRMSVKNGYKGSFQQWKYMSGSVLIINVSDDLCLSTREAPGQSVYSTFQIYVTGTTCTANSYNSYAGVPNEAMADMANLAGVQHTLYVATVTPGTALIGGGQAQFMTEGPSAAQVYAMLNAPGVKLQKSAGQVERVGATSGGGFLSGIKNLMSSAVSSGADWVKKHPEVVQSAIGKLADMAGGATVAGDLPASDAASGGSTAAGSLRKRRY